MHGAFAIHIGDVALGLALARTPTTIKNGGTRISLWQRHDITAWPESFGRNASESWKTLVGLASRWQWIAAIFGDEANFKECLVAYYMALCVLEFVELLRGGSAPPVEKPETMYLDIPPVYEVESTDVKRRAYRVLVVSGLKQWILSTGVDVGAIRQNWNSWMGVQRFWHRQLYPYSIGEMALERFVSDVFGN